jgi:hypothetical protein
VRGSGAYLPEGVVKHVADANLRWRTFPIYRLPGIERSTCPRWALYVNLTAPCQLMILPVTCQDHPSLERSAVNLHRGDKSVFIKDAGSESLVDTRASSRASSIA